MPFEPGNSRGRCRFHCQVKIKGRSYRSTFCLNFQIFFCAIFSISIFSYFLLQIVEFEAFQILRPLCKNFKLWNSLFFLFFQFSWTKKRRKIWKNVVRWKRPKNQGPFLFVFLGKKKGNNWKNVFRYERPRTQGPFLLGRSYRTTFFPRFSSFFQVKQEKQEKHKMFPKFGSFTEGKIFGALRIPIFFFFGGKFGNTENCSKENLEI